MFCWQEGRPLEARRAYTDRVGDEKYLHTRTVATLRMGFSTAVTLVSLWRIPALEARMNRRQNEFNKDKIRQ